MKGEWVDGVPKCCEVIEKEVAPAVGLVNEEEVFQEAVATVKRSRAPHRAANAPMGCLYAEEQLQQLQDMFNEFAQQQNGLNGDGGEEHKEELMLIFLNKYLNITITKEEAVENIRLFRDQMTTQQPQQQPQQQQRQQQQRQQHVQL
eukprot:GHVS01015514.1.p1 GENE.GHVS01015514.1~~GHVS01015514.1.p1  ORF type:complete len:147 (-),score=51.31 GHVS01015514.1:29-469(-)